MRHNGFLVAAVISAVAGFLLSPATASAGSSHAKRVPPYPLPHAGEGREGMRGYGFLPGYEPPEVVEWRSARVRRPAFWYGGPDFTGGAGMGADSDLAGRRPRSDHTG